MKVTSMKKRKRKLNQKTLTYVLLFLILIVSILLWNKLKTKSIKISERDFNTNYLGLGKKQVSKKDGYSTTFTTLGERPLIYKEFKQNGFASWKDRPYWEGTMKDNGCGITAIAILFSGYHLDYTPEDLRKMYSPVLKTAAISNELRKHGLNNSNFYYDEWHLEKRNIIEHLKTNRPILICVWENGKKNRWTTTSHYMVLLATDGELIYVSNPNGLEGSEKASGWYKPEEVIPYIAKALYIESYGD